MLTPTGFAPLREHSAEIAIDQMVSRAKALYSLPGVAAEVLRLTDDPSVEPRAIKECIQRDPALTVKILRVVNSSLFGLAGGVSDLNQAIALLGTKPLKILVLGFSLPDNLFAGVAREQLKWYWTNTLTRAVAARDISERLFKAPGDEAFLAGLLQDLGVLVLARQLGSSYAGLLKSVIDTRVELRKVERETLGFDHLELTLAMLRAWNMPRQLCESIACQDDPMTLAREHRLSSKTDRSLHLANLMTELVGQHRLSVLPDLLEAGEAYCQLDRQGLHDLIVSLQPKVNQLADVLSLEVGDAMDYGSILLTAHERMSELAETALGPTRHLSDNEFATPTSVLEVASQLQVAMSNFLSQSPKEQTDKLVASDTTREAPAYSDEFVKWITLLAANCRSRRQSLSVLIIEVCCAPDVSKANDNVLTKLIETELHELLPRQALTDTCGTGKRIIVLPDVDRQETVRIAHRLVRAIEQSYPRSGKEMASVVSVGIGSVTVPSKSFRPGDILSTAERCLTAARSREKSLVKSLEIY